MERMVIRGGELGGDSFRKLVLLANVAARSEGDLVNPNMTSSIKPPGEDSTPGTVKPVQV